jgi:hypothetical protein
MSQKRNQFRCPPTRQRLTAEGAQRALESEDTGAQMLTRFPQFEIVLRYPQIPLILEDSDNSVCGLRTVFSAPSVFEATAGARRIQIHKPRWSATSQTSSLNKERLQKEDSYRVGWPVD